MSETKKSKDQILAELKQFLIDVIPNLAHNKVLGIEVMEVQLGSLELKLPYSEKIIGNPNQKIIHGGALTTLMDNASGFAAITAFAEEGLVLCPTLDLRIDYMRSATPGKDVLGRAEVYRLSNNVVFVRGLAFHEDEEDTPIAHCTSTFMRVHNKDKKKKESK